MFHRVQSMWPCVFPSLLAAAVGTFVSAARAENNILDNANFFGPVARSTAQRMIDDIKERRGWTVVIETIPSLDGQEPRDRAIEQARGYGANVVLVLLARKEKKVEVVAHRSATKAFDPAFRRRLVSTFTSSFKKNQYDAGLLAAVKQIRDQALAREAAPPPPALPAPAARGAGSLFTYVLIGLAILFGLMILGRLMSGAAPAPSAAGAPAGGLGGGGFFSSLLGGLGGALLGNWIYDSLSGRHAGGGTWSSGAAPGAGDASASDYESTGGDWGDSGADDAIDSGGDWSDSGGGDWGGDSGGDWA